MKKLMMIMAMAAMASVLHGAALNWDGYGYNPYIENPPDTWPGCAWIEGGQVFLVWSYVNDGSLSVNYSGGSWVVTGGEIVDTGVWVGAAISGAFSGALNDDELLWGTSPINVYLAALIVTEADIDGTWYWGVTGTQTLAWNGTGMGFSFAGDGSDGWPTPNAVPIPEPATALLALAGIGMLIAQKRKRA